jgi:hypothetical protein
MPETCIVIGNGPSLRDVPVEFLDKYPTFGANRIYLHYTPTYFVCVNPLVIEQNRKEIEALECIKFVRAGMGMNGFQLHKGLSKPFSLNPLEWVNEGYTVTFVSLQLARHMDFKTVLLVGVDHRYQFDGKPDEVHLLEGDDPNHFDPEYFKGQRWQNPDLMKSEWYYTHARGMFEAEGRRIINLTPNSALDVFEKGNLSEWM